MPVVFAGQGDLFDHPRQAACMRHELGWCSGPCAGFVTEWDYRRRVETATAFLEGRTIQPIDRIIAGDAGGRGRGAVRAGGAVAREVRTARVAARRHEPRADGDRSADVRLPRSGRLRRRPRIPASGRASCGPSFPYPTTPIEHEAFRAVVAEEAAAAGPAGRPLPPEAIDEILLMMSWFRAHPEALRRTTPYAEWAA